MKNKFISTLTRFITQKKDYDEIKIKTIKYGLEVLYLSITKLLVLFAIVLLIDTVLEFLLLLIFYQLIRKYSFGLHASKSIICWLITLPIYIGGSLIIKHFSFNINICYIIWLLAFISFILWAPADTPKRPLIREKQRKTQKLKTCLICILYLLLITFSKNIIVVKAIVLSLIIQMIMVNPFIYKITNTRFNNYRFYPNKV